MKIRRPLLLIAGGFVLGEAFGLRSEVAMEAVAAAALSLACCVCFCVLWDTVCGNGNTGIFFTGKAKGRSLYKWLLPVFMFSAALTAGCCRAQAVRQEAEACQALELDGKWGNCTGTVKRLVRRKERWEVILRLQELEVYAGPSAMPKYLLVYVKDSDAVHLCAEAYEPGIVPKQKEVRIKVGSRITVKGRLQAFEAARNPGEFDFQDYYQAKKLFFRMSAEQCQWEKEAYDQIGDSLFWAADYAGRVLNDITDSKSAGIFRAVLLGDRTGMDEELFSLYRRSGVAHLLAVSGLHLSLAGLAVYGGLRRTGLGFGLAGLAGGAVLGLYASMTGMAPSIQRALVMALCGYLAAYLGRTYDLLSALSLAGIMIFWDNPYALTQAGVQLSFAAVLGIGAAAPRLLLQTPKEKKNKNRFYHMHQFRQTLAVSMGIQLVTAPLVLYHFFEIPLYGMILNLLVVPFMGIVLASGAAGILLGSWNAAAGSFAIGGGCGILVFYRWLCRQFLLLPGANIVLGRPHPWQMGIYYGVLAAYLLFREFGFLQKMKSWSMVLLAVVLLPLPQRGMQVTFLDVGQGDGICIRTASGVVLVDGGSSDEKNLGENILKPFLKNQGITKVDYAVVSHGDQDHINGLTELLQPGQDISVSCLVLPAAGYGDTIYGQLEYMAKKHGAKILWMGAGDRLKLGNLVVECLYPGRPSGSSLLSLQTEDSDRNEHSLVLRVSFGNFRMLLTGDMSEDGERAVMRKLGLAKPVHVLKVAHHGSKFSTSPEWLGVLHPAWAVISCGRKNRYGHPHERVLDDLQKRGIVVWMTPERGAVRLNTDGERIWWKLFLSDL